MDRLNILSLDWDYFIAASYLERGMLFPDGGTENLAPLLQDFVWAGRYTNGELEKIRTDVSAIRQVKKLFRSTGFEPEIIAIADSHAHLYDIVHQAEPDMHKPINLLNVDFHHDVYNISDEVDCGNWLRFLMKEYDSEDSQFTWVKREDSDDIYDPIFLVDHVFDLSITTDLNQIFEWDWDVIFICRSAMWSPPHLDSSFRNTFHMLTQAFPHVYTEKNVFVNRYHRIKKISDQTRGQFESISMFIGGD